MPIVGIVLIGNDAIPELIYLNLDDSEMICYPFVFDHKGRRYVHIMVMILERQALDWRS